MSSSDEEDDYQERGLKRVMRMKWRWRGGRDEWHKMTYIHIYIIHYISCTTCQCSTEEWNRDYLLLIDISVISLGLTFYDIVISIFWVELQPDWMTDFDGWMDLRYSRCPLYELDKGQIFSCQSNLNEQICVPVGDYYLHEFFHRDR